MSNRSHTIMSRKLIGSRWTVSSDRQGMQAQVIAVRLHFAMRSLESWVPIWLNTVIIWFALVRR